MGLVNAVYNWGSVKALYFAVLSMNLAGIVALGLTIVWAVRFERGFGGHLNLVASGDGHVWTTVIICAAVLCSPAYILALKCLPSLKMDPVETTNPEDLEKPEEDSADPRGANRLLFFHVIACLVSGFLVAILNATYFALSSGFHQKSRDGLIEAMERYGRDVAAKTRVDAVQTEFECCGDNGYEDWFHVPWLKLSIEGPDYTEKGPRLEGQEIPEDQEEESPTPADVPFSCCSNDIPKPCVHHDILNRNAAYNYDPSRLTIATVGCRSRILRRGKIVRIYLAGYLTLLSVYQIVLSLLSRLLQTAHSNALYIGPRNAHYHVWIFFKPDGIVADEPPTRPKETEGLLRLRKRRSTKNSRPSSSISTSGTSDEEEEVTDASIKRGKLKSLDRGSRLRTNKFRGSKQNTYRLEDEYEGVEEAERNATRSTTVVLKADRDSNSLLSANSSIEDLPPPPPPPPFLATLDVEEEVKRKATADNNEFKERIIANRNSGRRIKVFEKFGKIWERQDHRECGGADDDSSNERASNRSRRGQSINATDVYDRFRGTLQHTLARRETVQARKTNRIHSLRICTNVAAAKRNKVLTRLGCRNVPPSYRLLANVEDQPSAPPLPPPNPNPNPSVSFRRQRQCSICRGPV
ncbi:uncharacterized protein LOC143349974 [Colletes latitarsis]|uniref:uncharacterized protein LOC143349974 n=1 Tax=Colletes latitarsis TaxID=2605962 RepID=UPI00403676DD